MRCVRNYNVLRYNSAVFSLVSQDFSSVSELSTVGDTYLLHPLLDLSGFPSLSPMSESTGLSLDPLCITDLWIHRLHSLLPLYKWKSADVLHIHNNIIMW
ncbi:hypothetical protein AVEN_232064-1 [Araneus ventricosus]|uniref:Uncharacterized protein n=1 Tax=Araneus ventricosus TaxID=182803 RepID=A0A4Y2U070_ARAVE|nr:hypothetical protein AVEN_4859-1 [Araneus ventricosus]GBO04987.1 hypothetical protein AVEN_232064-1 [Araneus ventricosus]